MLAGLQAQPARMLIRPIYQQEGQSRWIEERARIRAVALPLAVGGTPQAKDLSSRFDDTVQRLLEALR